MFLKGGFSFNNASIILHVLPGYLENTVPSKMSKTIVKGNLAHLSSGYILTQNEEIYFLNNIL